MAWKFRSPIIKTDKSALPADAFFPIQWTGSDINNIVSSLLGQKKVTIETKTRSGQRDAYDNCPIIGTIIDRRADFFQSSKLMIVDSNNQELTNADARAVIRLLTNPNPMMDGDEFNRTVSLYYNCFGFCPIYKVYPAQRTTGLPTALWPIDPLLFNYQLTGKLYSATKISDVVNNVWFSNPAGEQIRLAMEQIDNQLWIFNGKINHKNDYYTAQSPLYGLADAINMFNVGLNVYGQLLKQSILGIIGTRDRSAYAQTPMKPAEKSDVQTKLSNKYGLIEGKDNYIITNKDLFFQSLLTNIGQLAIPEAIVQAINVICDRLGMRPELLSDKVATFENQKTAEISQYNTQTIPYATKYAKCLTELLILKGMRVSYSFDDVSVLQENKKEEADLATSYTNAANIMVQAAIITREQAAQFLIENDVLEDNFVYVEQKTEQNV